MRVSAIDIGTNTILLLIADVEPDGSIKVLRDEQVIARLGKGVDANRHIVPETFERALSYLREYKKMSDESRADLIVACGTSFLRDARNRQEFIQFIRERIRIEIRILSGEEEASLTYSGAISECRKPALNQSFAVLDIGGGSTELTVGTETVITKRLSLDIGSVRITERFLKTSPPLQRSLEETTQFISIELEQLPPFGESIQLIGVAGTLTTLAALDLKLAHYDRAKVSGHLLKRSTIESIFTELKTKNLEEIKSYPQIFPGRADIILAGILILLETLRKFNREDILVSDRGLRFGMALQAESL